VKETKTDIKNKAITFIKQAKLNKKIPIIAKNINFENKTDDIKNNESWFYKVASGAIKPSLERSIDVIEYCNKNTTKEAA